MCTGRGESESDVYSDTWALDMANLEWIAINTTHNPEVPEGRFDAAGGVYGNKLWLSMGRNKDKRILSDTWILSINFTDTGEIVGEHHLPTHFITHLPHIHAIECTCSS